jgi:ATP-dependent Clp protease ATP-binding subunit ClpC
MEDGSLADAKGRKVDFRNTIIIMTSNVGADEISKDMTMGFVGREDEERTKRREYSVMKDKVMSRLRQTFRPEFLNRIDATIVFHSLTQEQIREIVDLEMRRVRDQLAEQDIILDIDVAAKDLLGERGYDHTYGARPLRRIIQNMIEDPLAEGLLTGRFLPGHTVRVTVEDGLLKLEEAKELAVV